MIFLAKDLGGWNLTFHHVSLYHRDCHNYRGKPFRLAARILFRESANFHIWIVLWTCEDSTILNTRNRRKNKRHEITQNGMIEQYQPIHDLIDWKTYSNISVLC